LEFLCLGNSCMDCKSVPSSNKFVVKNAAVYSCIFKSILNTLTGILGSPKNTLSSSWLHFIQFFNNLSVKVLFPTILANPRRNVLYQGKCITPPVPGNNKFFYSGIPALKTFSYHTKTVYKIVPCFPCSIISHPEDRVNNGARF